MKTSQLDLVKEIKALQQELRIERFRRQRLESQMRHLRDQVHQKTTKLELQLTEEIKRLTRAVDGDDSMCEESMTGQRDQDQAGGEFSSRDSGAHSSTPTPMSDSIDISVISPENPFGGAFIPTTAGPAPSKQKRPIRENNEEKRRRTEGDAVPSVIATEQIPQPASFPQLSTRNAARPRKESAGRRLLRISNSNGRDSSSQACTQETDGLNASTKLINTYRRVQDAKESEPLVEIIAKLREAVLQTLDDWQPKKPIIIAKKMELVMEMCSTTSIHHFKASNMYSFGPQSPWPTIVQKVFNDHAEPEQKELMKHVTLSARQSANSYFGTLVDLLVQRHAEHCAQCKLAPGDTPLIL